MEKMDIGVIVRPFGIKGEVKVKLYTDFPEQRFAIGNVVTLTYSQQTTDLKIDSFRMHQGFALVRFEQLHNINDIEHFRNATISIDKKLLHELEEDEYYYFELIGLRVFEDEVVLGEVIEIVDSLAHPILRVKTGDKDLLIPYVNAFILDVDMEEKRIDVKLIEGMK
ncbi:MAG TPA: 16S rRNA processing protein RimM [Erysipelotrichaceae bacterium]|nr:16S rRNA processing protein RimM [Erysipelotrichaceae bacterium]